MPRAPLQAARTASTGRERQKARLAARLHPCDARKEKGAKQPVAAPTCESRPTRSRHDREAAFLCPSTPQNVQARIAARDIQPGMPPPRAFPAVTTTCQQQQTSLGSNSRCRSSTGPVSRASWTVVHDGTLVWSVGAFSNRSHRILSPRAHSCVPRRCPARLQRQSEVCPARPHCR